MILIVYVHQLTKSGSRNSDVAMIIKATTYYQNKTVNNIMNELFTLQVIYCD